MTVVVGKLKPSIPMRTVSLLMTVVIVAVAPGPMVYVFPDTRAMVESMEKVMPPAVTGVRPVPELELELGSSWSVVEGAMICSELTVKV